MLESPAPTSNTPGLFKLNKKISLGLSTKQSKILLSSIFLGSSCYYASIIFNFLFQLPEIFSYPEVTVPLTGEKTSLVVGVTDGRVEGQTIRTKVSFGFILTI